MRKALIITNLSGFLWKFELDNVALLQSLGYEVHFASNINEKGYEFELYQLEELGIAFHHIDIARSPYMWKMNAVALKQIKGIVQKEKIDIIHCHTPVGALLGRLVSVGGNKSINPKVIYTAHGFHFYKGAPLLNNIVYKAVEYCLAPLTDVLVVINAEDYQQAQKLHLKKGGRVEQISGVGIEFSKFLPASEEEKKEIRREYAIPEDAFFALSVGELNLNKNHKTIISTIKQMKAENANIVYGICGNGYWRNDIQNFAMAEGVDDRVIFFGYQEEIRKFYAMADVTIFPSKREGLGMVGIESLAMEIPVIAADNRGTREYMQDGKNGYVCCWNDVDGFKNAIYKYQSLSAFEKEKMKHYCRESVLRFDKTFVREKMRAIYTRLDQEVFKDAE